MKRALTSFPAENAANSSMVDAEQLCNLGLGHRVSKRTNVANLIVGKFRYASPASSLFLHIVHVVQHGSDKQMLRINARSDVAAMEHLKSLGDRSEVDHPTQSVGVFRPKRMFLARVKRAVSMSRLALPKPASAFRLLNLFPKANGQVSGISFINHPLRGIVVLHNKLFLFAALQDVSASLRQFFYPISDPIANQI